MNKFLIAICLLLATTPAHSTVDWDGVDDCMTCGTSDNLLQEDQPLTIAFWFNADTAGENSTGRVIAKGIEPTSGTKVFLRSTGAVEFGVPGVVNLARRSAVSAFSFGRTVVDQRNRPLAPATLHGDKSNPGADLTAINPVLNEGNEYLLSTEGKSGSFV